MSIYSYTNWFPCGQKIPQSIVQYMEIRLVRQKKSRKTYNTRFCKLSDLNISAYRVRLAKVEELGQKEPNILPQVLSCIMLYMLLLYC